MAKYSFEFKKSVVEAYLKGKVVMGIYLKSMVLNLVIKFTDGLKIIRSLGTPG